jgi:hypothetical protein
MNKVSLNDDKLIGSLETVLNASEDGGRVKTRERTQKRAGGAGKRGIRASRDGHRVEFRSPEDLKPYERNPLKHPPEQIALIVRSIKEFGFTVPILCDEDWMILAGHGRQLAAAQMKLKSVPVIRKHGLTRAQKIAYVMADNQIARTADFDLSMIAAELKRLSEEFSDFDLGVIGFTEVDVAKFLDPLFGKQSPDTGKLLEVLRVTLDDPKHEVEHGEVWDAGQHTIICRDLFTEWDDWVNELTPGTIFLPYAGPLVLLTDRAKTTRLLIVNPQAYVCAMILDKFVEAKLGTPIKR